LSNDPGGRAVYGVGLWPPACWDWGFEPRKGHECVSYECRVLSGRGTCDGPTPFPDESYL